VIKDIKYKGVVNDTVNFILKKVMPKRFTFEMFKGVMKSRFEQMEDATIRTHLSRLYYDGKIDRIGKRYDKNKLYIIVPVEDIQKTKIKRLAEKRNGTAN